MVNISNDRLLNIGNSIKESVSIIKDSIAVDLQVKYQNQGLTYVSNNVNVVPRNENGNIALQEGVDNNPLLIIEPTVNRVTTKSMLRVLDTQFKYFKFPARTTVVDEDVVDLDLDLDLQSLDPVFARYRPSENRPILAGPDYSGILIDEVQEGLSQQSTNTYTISKDIKNSGVDLRFRIKLQHRYDEPTGQPIIVSTSGNGAPQTIPAPIPFGTAFFSIIKTSEQGLDRDYRTFENTSEVQPNIPGSINQYEVQDLEVDIVIPNSEFEIGDRFGIGAKAGQNNATEFHTINALQSYWVISDASKNVDLWNQEINA
jgi:hypothetical protein